MEHVLPTDDSGRLVSTMENGQLSFPGIRAIATEANVDPKTNMTPTATNNRLNMKPNLTKYVSVMISKKGTPCRHKHLEAKTYLFVMNSDCGNAAEI